MTVARYQRQTSTLARDHPRQDPAARHTTRSESTAARLPKAKLTQTSQLSSTEGNHRDYWRVLTDQCPETSHSQRDWTDEILGTSVWKSKERIRKSTPNHRSPRYQPMPRDATAPPSNVEASGRIGPRPSITVGSNIRPQSVLSPSSS